MMDQPPRFLFGIDFGTDDTTVLSLWMREGRAVAPRAGSTAAGMCLLMANGARVMNDVVWICHEHVTRPLISMLLKRWTPARLVSARRARWLRRRGELLIVAPPTSTGKARYRYFPSPKS